MASDLPLLSGFEHLAERYRGLIVDLFGVLHNGEAALPKAVEAARRYRTGGGKLLILSNAPRRNDAVRESCAAMGIDDSVYDYLLSSGEETWRHLKTRPDSWYAALGQRCFHMGPDQDPGMRADLDLDFVETPEKADFVLHTGAHMPEDSLERYAEVTRRCAKLKLPMICANPDLEVLRGSTREICAGAVAAYYETLGGEVRYHGKPHADIYQRALGLLDLAPGEPILCIGDTLRTDVAGAQVAGLDSLWILSGIHAQALGLTPNLTPAPETLSDFCTVQGWRPTYALDWLRW